MQSPLVASVPTAVVAETETKPADGYAADREEARRYIRALNARSRADRPRDAARLAVALNGRTQAHALAARRNGWTPEELANAVASTGAIRDAQDARLVVTALGTIAETPSIVDVRPVRPDWCGQCDERTRHREGYDERPYKCPDCHPTVVVRHDAERDAYYAGRLT